MDQKANTYYSRDARVIRGGEKITTADVERFLKDSGPWAEIHDIRITRPSVAEFLGMDVRYIQVAGYKFSTRNGEQGK